MTAEKGHAHHPPPSNSASRSRASATTAAGPGGRVPHVPGRDRGTSPSRSRPVPSRSATTWWFAPSARPRSPTDAQKGCDGFLLLNRPLDCPSATRAGVPAAEPGHERRTPETRFEGVEAHVPLPINIIARRSCWTAGGACRVRGARFADEIAGDAFIDLLERGASSRSGSARTPVRLLLLGQHRADLSGQGADQPVPLPGPPSTWCPCRPCLRTLRQQVARCAPMCAAARCSGDSPVMSRRSMRVELRQGRFAFRTSPGPHHPPARPATTTGDRTASWPEALGMAADALTAAVGSAAVLTGGRLTSEDAFAYSSSPVRSCRPTTWTSGRDPTAPRRQTSCVRSWPVPRVPTYTDLQSARRSSWWLSAGGRIPDRVPAPAQGRDQGHHQGLCGRPWASPGLSKLSATVLAAGPVGDQALAGSGMSCRLCVNQAQCSWSESGPPPLPGCSAGPPRPLPTPVPAWPGCRAEQGSAVRWRQVCCPVWHQRPGVNWLPASDSPVSSGTGDRCRTRGGTGSGAGPRAPGRRPRRSCRWRTKNPNRRSGPWCWPGSTRGTSRTGRPWSTASRRFRPSSPSRPTHNDATRARGHRLPGGALTEKAGSFIDWEGRRQPFLQVFRESLILSDAGVLAAIADGCWGLRSGRPDRVAGGGVHGAARDPPDRPSVAGARCRETSAGEAVLSTWRQLVDDGSMQAGEPYLAATARPAVVRIGPANAADLGISDGDPVTLTGTTGSVTLPALITDMPAGVVWPPGNSGANLVADLGVTSGDTVRVSVGRTS